ncbi:hypothetical protein ACFLU1_02480 [Chloroflexota bacterium]
MINLFSQLPSLITPANAIATKVGEGLAGTDTIGFIVLGIIVGPVIVLSIASILEPPRTFRVPALFVGSLIVLVGAIIASFAAVGIVLKFIVPQ